jgi:RTC4-like domain
VSLCYLPNFLKYSLTTCVSFGERGAAIIFDVLRVIFGPKNAHGFPFADFARRVLLPEAAVLLAQSDLGVSREEAIDIIQKSRHYGMTMHPQTDSQDEEQYFIALRKRWEDRNIDVKVKMEQQDVVVKSEQQEFDIELRVLVEDGKEIIDLS